MSTHLKSNQQIAATENGSSEREKELSNAIADELHPVRPPYIPGRRRLSSVREGNPDHERRAVIVKWRPVRQLIGQAGSKGLVSDSASRFSAAGHWALEVGDFTYELLVDNGNSEFFFGEWLSAPQGETDCVKRIKVGNCQMSDEEICHRAVEVFNRMYISGKGYSKFANNCQRYVRLLSSKLCANSMTDWIATNSIFVTKVIPSSTLIKEAKWVGANGLVTCVFTAFAILANAELKVLISTHTVPTLLGYGSLMSAAVFPGFCIGSLIYTPLIIANTYGKTVGRKVKWSLQVDQKEYMKVYGSRNIQLEALDAAFAMVFKGPTGRSFANQWFKTARPEGLSTYRSLLDITSGHQAVNSREFIDWISKVPKTILENEKPALTALAHNIGSTVKEKATIENGILAVQRSKAVISDKITVKNAKKAYQMAKIIGKEIITDRRSRETQKSIPSGAPPRVLASIPVSFSNEPDKDTEGDDEEKFTEDDMRDLQVVVPCTDAAKEFFAETDEGDGTATAIHVGDLHLLEEWLRAQGESSMD